MADSLSNTCEGTNGTTVSTANSAGPNQFTAVSLTGAGATCVWDNTQAHGGLTAIKNTLINAVACSSNQNWSGATINPTPVANAYMRWYLFLTAYPTVTTRIAALVGSAALRGSLQITTTGTIRTINTAGGVVATTTAVVPLSAWCRIEFEGINATGSAIDLNARMYSAANLETNTPDTNGTLANAGNVTAGLVDDVRFGHSSSVTMTANWSTWYDDVAFSDTAPIGPVVLPAPGPGFFNGDDIPFGSVRPGPRIF